MNKETEFRKALEDTINRFSRENGSNTPDFILADYLAACLLAFDEASRAREKWYGTELKIGGQDSPEHSAFNCAPCGTDTCQLPKESQPAKEPR
jgi:hypothetical protein